MKEIKVGIVGAGGIAGGKHLPGHRSVKGVEVIAVCDIVEERAKSFAKQHNIPNVFTDYKDLVAMEELDAVSVCTPNNFHPGPTIAALEAGKHVICEKPLAGNAKDGQAMVDAAKKSGKILQIGLQSRFDAGARTLRKLVEAGEFGDIYYARAMAMRRRGMPASSTFITKKIAGGGPLIDIGVHILDVLLWVIGNPKPVKVFGSIATKFGKRDDVINPWGKWDPKQFDVEDFAMGVIKFEGGLTVTLETAWASHTGNNIGTTFFMGDKAGATLHPPRIYIDKGGEMVDYEPEIIKGEPGEFQSFHNAIREGLPSPVPAEQVLDVQKIFDAIYASARRGHAVTIKIRKP
jgi:predicted dehydrogenase